eukprot:SAG25_NODE_487_length_7465_cov_4.695900_3_plen_95_part_00
MIRTEEAAEIHLRFIFDLYDDTHGASSSRGVAQITRWVVLAQRRGSLDALGVGQTAALMMRRACHVPATTPQSDSRFAHYMYVCAGAVATWQLA